MNLLNFLQEKLDLKLNKVDYIDDKNQIIKVLSRY